MTQLVKHYYINRDTGGWAIDTPYGLMMPNIKGLEIKHRLSNENGVPFFLSEVPEYFEYEVTISQEQLTEYQNNSNITVVSSTERQVEVPVFDRPGAEPTGETRTETVYDVIYRESYILEESEGEGLRILTQLEWDNEIDSYNNFQIQKKYNILREIRGKILEITDWMVIKNLEQNGSVSNEFKIWRQALRDIPSSNSFPTGFPVLPQELENNLEVQNLYGRFDEINYINVILD